jgi:hypothetical protein
MLRSVLSQAITALMMEAASTFETTVEFCETAPHTLL